MGKYDDAIGGGKIIVDVEEILNEEAADKVDKKIKTQKAELEKPIKVTVEIDDKSISKLKQLTEAVKKNSDNLQQAMQSGRNISELSDYIQTHKQLERQIKAVTKRVKSNNTEVSKSKQVLIDAQNVIDQISISIEKNNRIDYLDKTVKGATQAVSAISKFQQLLGDLGKKYGEATFSSIFGGVVSSFKAIDESNASQAYDALIAKDREYQSQLEEESKVRERITQEVKAYAEATKYIYKNGEPSQDILNAYVSYWEKVSAGAMSAADAVKAFEEEWNQLGSAVDYQQKQQIDEIRSLIRNQKEWLKYLEQSLNPDNFKTSGKKEATQKLRDLTSRLIHARKNNYQDDTGNQYNRQMIEVAWAQGYKEAQRQNVAQSTLTRYQTDALYSYDDNLKTLQDAYDFRKKLLAQYEEELNKINQITSATEKQVSITAQTTESREQANNTAVINTETKAIEANARATEENIKAKQKMERQDLRSSITEIPQEFTSKKTSINSNKLPAIFGKSNSKYVILGTGTTNLDYGGGRFDNVTEYLSGRGVRNLVYDPYNRTKEHNDDVIRVLQEQGLADTATLSNVLNVIKEQEVRNNVLQNLSKLVKPGGQVYITVYEGTGKGDEGPTSAGYQLNRRTEDYLDEIQQVFPDAVRHGKLIVATNNVQALPQTQHEQQAQLQTKMIEETRPEQILSPIQPSVEPNAVETAIQESTGGQPVEVPVTPVVGEITTESAQEVAQSIVSATTETTSTAAGQLAQEIQQVGDTAQQTAQQLRQQAAATEILTSSSEQATQQVEQQATITERSASPSQTPNVLPALTVPERIATIGNGAIDNLLEAYNITNPEAQSEVVNAFDEMTRIIKAVFDKAKVEGPVSNKDNLFVRLQESADKASSLIIQLGTEAHDTSESLDGLRDFYSFMKGKKIRYNNSIKAEYGDGWGKFYNRFKNYLTPSPTAETAGSLYKHLSGEASDGTGLPNANIDVFRQFFSQDLGDDIHQFARIFEVLGNALDASNGGRSWKKIDKIPLKNTSNENKQYIRGQVQDIQIGMIQTLKQMTDASAEALRNEEQLVEGERAVGDAVRNTNEARREGNEEQRKAIQDVGDVSKNKRQSIIEHNKTKALEVLRKAKDNKTNLVDLSGVYSTDDLKSQLESMASTVTSKGNLLSVGSVHIQDNIASVTMYNEALGITYKQLYEVSKAAEDAEESQLKLWSESYDENYKAAQKYSEAQKKKIAKDDSWLIGQASKLNTQERKYKYSREKVEGTTALTDADETSLAEGADRTIDSLTAHIKNKIQSAMGQGLTNEVRNEIINDLRILDNEIKIEQYKQYASTTMKPSELTSAKDELEYTLQSLEAKAKKNNVFSQIEQDVISLRSQLKGVVDGTQLSKFIDDLRVTKSKLNAEIAKEQTTKKEEQNYQNLINLQNRLYEAKKKLNDLEIKGQSDTAEGQQASRKVQELQDQYNLSVKLLQNEEHRRAIEDRGAGLDSQLNTAKDQKQIEQYYQNIFDTVQRVNNLDSQINTFKMKDGGKGIYSDLIASLESEKATLLGKINQIGADVNQHFNGVFASVGDVEKVQLPFNSLLKDTSAYSTILDFLNSVDVRATLGAEAVNKLVQAFYNSSQAGSEFAGKISAQFRPAEEAFARLQQIISSGGLNVDNDGTYQQMKQRFDTLQQLSQTDMSKWSAEGIAYFTNLANSVAEYANSLSKAAEQEANYFAGKTKAYAGDTMYGNSQKNELMVVDQPDKNIDTARQALERYVAAFTEGKGVITGFTTAANGISQITFSALDEGTGQFRTFTAEMGRCTDNIYRTEATLNGLASGTNVAKKSIASLATVMSQLNGVSGAEEQLKALWEVYQNLQNTINNKGNSQNVGDQNMLKNMATDADKARKEVEKLIKEWAKSQAGLDNGSLTPLGSIDKNGNIKEQMWGKIKTSTDGARASFVDFDEKTNTLTYTLMNADKTVTTMTAHMYGLNGAVTAQQGKTEKLKTGWQEFTGAFGGVAKGIGQYLSRAFSVWAIVGQIKKGFNAVKQIDAALTELKKVTDETEGSYQRFLNTASQTAGKIGSTVSDFTQASANFARLGYTMEESAKMAETAIVYKNVADGLDTVEESTESIISTMKAFGIESDNTMSIIDRFNEVGNNFSITSAGIGEALQRSASALYEAGNSIDESIALVTAGNSVIQNPEQVGK